jgi:hypothetical protein
MVKIIVAVLFLLVLTIPVMAQDEFPRMEVGMGYANVGFPTGLNGETQRHSGFSMHTGLNFTRNLGIENYTGFYSLGEGVTLISNIVGGKVALRRAARIVPYGVAGLGASYATSSYASSGTAFSTRLGGGVDIPLNDALSLKFDISRMGFHFGTWSQNTNFSTGIVFTLAN